MEPERKEEGLGFGALGLELLGGYDMNSRGCLELGLGLEGLVFSEVWGVMVERSGFGG